MPLKYRRTQLSYLYNLSKLPDVLICNKIFTDVEEEFSIKKDTPLHNTIINELNLFNITLGAISPCCCAPKSNITFPNPNQNCIYHKTPSWIH